MLIQRRSPRTGKVNTMDLPITQEQIDLWQHHSVLIQVALPDLTDGQREFLMTGLTEEDWAILFPEDQE